MVNLGTGRTLFQHTQRIGHLLTRLMRGEAPVTDVLAALEAAATAAGG
jgi:hypothetical protein